MIYTVTFNPALDYILSSPGFTMGMTNRAAEEQLFPGGKGINVSIVLQHLGVESTALGFLAGFTGKEIQRKLTKEGVREEFLFLPKGYSRINVKLKDVDGTELNGQGPAIDEESLTALSHQLSRLTKDDVLVLAGSIPESIPDTIYRDLTKELGERGVPVAVDATKELLLQVLPYGPFLVKPNHHELGELFGVTLHTREEVVPYAKRLQEMGAKNVLVSMSKEGAVLADAEGGVHLSTSPKGTLVNAVGAGDSMVAGFLAGWLKSRSYEQAFYTGLAAGSASAFSENLASKEEVERLYREMAGSGEGSVQ